MYDTFRPSKRDLTVYGISRLHGVNKNAKHLESKNKIKNEKYKQNKNKNENSFLISFSFFFFFCFLFSFLFSFYFYFSFRFVFIFFIFLFIFVFFFIFVFVFVFIFVFVSVFLFVFLFCFCLCFHFHFSYCFFFSVFHFSYLESTIAPLGHHTVVIVIKKTVLLQLIMHPFYDEKLPKQFRVLQQISRRLDVATTKISVLWNGFKVKQLANLT